MALTLEQARKTDVDEKRSLLDCLALPVDRLGLSPRVNNCFRNASIEFAWQAATRIPGTFSGKIFKNFGNKSYREVRETLAELGIKLGLELESDLCCELERLTGAARLVPAVETARVPEPPSADEFPAEPASPMPAQTRTDGERRSIADDLREAAGRLRALQTDLDAEKSRLELAMRCHELGMPVTLEEHAHPAVRRFYESCGGSPTWDQMDARVKALKEALKALKDAFHSTWTSKSPMDKVLNALALLED